MNFKNLLLVKKIFLIKIIFFWSFIFFLKFSWKVSALEHVKWEEGLIWCKNQKFLITAYYSPLPGQRFYMRWDYMADIRLNWNWTNWADWTEVYMWLLAWPKWYNFWQKIVLPWLWIWTIHDRWWAILAKSNYHRIDIWMWKWESWLARALNWGIQFVDWKVCGKSPELDNLSFLWVSWKLPPYVEKRLIDRTNNLKNWWSYTFKWSWVWWKKITIWWSWWSWWKTYISPKPEIFEFVKIPQDVWFWDEWQDVLKLQIVLKNIWFYRESPNWVYDNATMEAVFNFQRENWVVESLDNLWAWHFWKNTKKALEIFLKNMSEKSKKNVWSIQSELYSPGTNNTDKEKSSLGLVKKNIVPGLVQIDFKSSSKEDIFSFWENMSVKDIQKMLMEWKSVDEFWDFDNSDLDIS